MVSPTRGPGMRGMAAREGMEEGNLTRSGIYSGSVGRVNWDRFECGVGVGESPRLSGNGGSRGGQEASRIGRPAQDLLRKRFGEQTGA